jgi:hypothetical protein
MFLRRISMVVGKISWRLFELQSAEMRALDVTEGGLW